MIGRVLSHYRIVGSLGAGGMGVVYRAQDDRLGRAVALKFLPDDLADDPQAVERLRAEARAASALNHANICTVYDIGDDEGRPFIVLELLTGRTLREVLSSEPLKVHQLVDIAIQVADALDAAHSHGIVHRDIKPANIFLTDRHQAKLLDFGVAKLVETRGPPDTTASTKGRDLTLPGSTVGTVAYMSPEQATGEPLDGRTDLFSLGVVLYEGATGHHPFHGKTSALVLSAILNRAPVAPMRLNPDLPAHLQEIITNCLEKDRELRYQSAADLRADLKRLRRDLESGHSRTVDLVGEQGASVELPRDSGYAFRLRPTAAPAGRRRRLAVVSAAVGVAGLLGTGGYLLSRMGGAPDRSEQAPAVSEADLQSRIDQAAAELAARLTEQARQAAAEAAAALTPAPRTPPPPTAPPPASSRPAPSPPPAAAGPPRPATAPSAPPAPAPPVSVAPPAASSSRPAEPIGQAAPAPEAPGEPPPPAAVAPPPAPAPVPGPAAAPPAPARAPEDRGTTAEPAATAAAQDEAEIRGVVATYARAIETQDMALFRSIKPNLSPDEARRVESGFRAVARQTVELTIVSIDRQGTQAVVVVRRRDTIQAGGREQAVDSQQTMTLNRTGGRWVISDIR